MLKKNRRFSHESLEERLALDATGITTNECPDLDLSNLDSEVLTVEAGQRLSFSLLNRGALYTDPDGDDAAVRFVLDPDDNPAGARLTPAGAFDWTPELDLEGEFEIIVIAIDDGTPRLADAEIFTVTVTPRLSRLPLST